MRLAWGIKLSFQFMKSRESCGLDLLAAWLPWIKRPLGSIDFINFMDFTDL